MRTARREVVWLLIPNPANGLCRMKNMAAAYVPISRNRLRPSTLHRSYNSALFRKQPSRNPTPNLRDRLDVIIQTGPRSLCRVDKRLEIHSFFQPPTACFLIIRRRETNRLAIHQNGPGTSIALNMVGSSTEVTRTGQRNKGVASSRQPPPLGLFHITSQHICEQPMSTVNFK